MSGPSHKKRGNECLDEEGESLLQELEAVRTDEGPRRTGLELDRALRRVKYSGSQEEEERTRLRPRSTLQGDQSLNALPIQGILPQGTTDSDLNLQNLDVTQHSACTPVLQASTSSSNLLSLPSTASVPTTMSPVKSNNYLHQNSNGNNLLEGQKKDYDEYEECLSLLYYSKLSRVAKDSAELFFYSVELDELRGIATALDENPEANIQQTKCLSIAHYFIFQQTGKLEDLQKAIDEAEEAMAATKVGDWNYGPYLRDLIFMLVKRYRCSDSLEDLDQAIFRAVEMTNVTSRNHPTWPFQQVDLAKLNVWKFHITGSSVDGDKAMTMMNQALERCYGNPTKIQSWTDLATSSYLDFEKTGSLDSLQKAIISGERALAEALHSGPERSMCLYKVSIYFARRGKETLSATDMDQAIQMAEDAITAIPNGHPDQVTVLVGLAKHLHIRFDLIGNIEAINRAIEILLALSDPTCLHKSENIEYWLHDFGNIELWFELGKCLCTRSSKIGRSVDDIDKAISIFEIALRYAPLDSSIRSDLIHEHGFALSKRFEQNGSLQDLDRSINNYYELLSSQHLADDHAATFSSLGAALSLRFERAGAMDDINKAIEVAEEGLTYLPSISPIRAQVLANLGSFYELRFLRSREPADLEKGIKFAENALAIFPIDHPERCKASTIAVTLYICQAQLLGNRCNLDKCLQIVDAQMSRTLEATSANYMTMAGFFVAAGTCLQTLFKNTNDAETLNRAIECSRAALMYIFNDFDEDRRASMLLIHGHGLMLRFLLTRDLEDLGQAISSYCEGLSHKNATPTTRISLALKLSEAVLSVDSWGELISNCLQDAVELLPLVSPRYMEHTDKQYLLGKCAGLASVAAAAALNSGKDPYTSLRILELGRGVISSLLLDMRTDVSALQEQHAELAEDFTRLRDELDSPNDEDAIPYSENDRFHSSSRSNRRAEADKQFQEVIAKIRSLPEFQSFLQPPTEAELMAAAKPGPIIVLNLSWLQCDAFLIEKHQIRILSLSDITSGEVEETARRLKSAIHAKRSDRLKWILGWLWHKITCPCLEALGFTQTPEDEAWPHVWWIPTGALTHFPLHAAGVYKDGSTNTVLDRVMSSYSSSVKSLIYGRRKSVQDPASGASDKALLVSMRTTPGLVLSSDLPNAVNEVKTLEKLCPDLSLTPFSPTPRKREVLEGLRTCKIFHFAGHGISHPSEPSRSSLLLEDWQTDQLTVGDLRDHKLQENSPFLGFLSACSTGANEVKELVDEGIHLISACQLAGFRHVIGTLWAVSDQHCADVSRVVYETLRAEGMTDEAVCKGLHKAMRALRDSSGPWITREQNDMPREANVHCGDIEGIPPNDGESLQYGSFISISIQHIGTDDSCCSSEESSTSSLPRIKVDIKGKGKATDMDESNPAVELVGSGEESEDIVDWDTEDDDTESTALRIEDSFIRGDRLAKAKSRRNNWDKLGIHLLWAPYAHFGV